MEEIKLNKIEVFDNYKIEKYEYGNVTLSTEVKKSSLNYYGIAHGGYLFTLCDQVAGLVAISTGFEAVTLQSIINYFKPGKMGERLFVVGKCIHNGKTTKVVDIEIRNREDKLLTKNSCTMYVTGTSDRGAEVKKENK